ncbi:MAG: hypothetical protein FH748_03615 [Balneolaceae bacterium]|nr:hypothetical protein [Balneolaceae bacterium]
MLWIILCLVIPHGTVQANQFVDVIVDGEQFVFACGNFLLVIVVVARIVVVSYKIADIDKKINRKTI